MAKKLSLLLAAVAVLAIAVPAMASAAPTLQYVSNSKPVPVGTLITGTGIKNPALPETKGVALTSSLLGEIYCEKLNLRGELKVNNDSQGIDGIGTSEKPEQFNCFNGPEKLPVTVTNVNLTDLMSTANGVVTANFTATVDIKEKECTFTGSGVTGSYTNGGQFLDFNKAGGITGSPAACGSAKLDARFSLETTAAKEALKGVFG